MGTYVFLLFIVHFSLLGRLSIERMTELLLLLRPDKGKRGLSAIGHEIVGKAR